MADPAVGVAEHARSFGSLELLPAQRLLLNGDKPVSSSVHAAQKEESI
jgi:hypothetical protein